MYRKRRLFVHLSVIMLAALLVLLSSCGTAGRQQAEVNYVKNKAALNKVTGRTKYIQRELFLTDANGLLVPQSIGLPESKSPIQQALTYLVADGPVSDILPNGFQAVLPSGTEVRSAHVDSRGQLTADFSKELLGASSASRTQMVQSIVWTATQFNNVKSVTLRVNGRLLTAWPKNGGAIGSRMTRSDGINPLNGTVADISASEPMTVYYLYVEKGKSYELPVTIRVNNQGNQLQTMVQALISEPAGTDFVSPLNPSTQLVSRPYVKNGIAYLHFNSDIYENKKAKTVSDQALDSLVLTLTDQQGINQVSVKIGNSSKMTLESGRSISGPVTRMMVSATGL